MRASLRSLLCHRPTSYARLRERARSTALNSGEMCNMCTMEKRTQAECDHSMATGAVAGVTVSHTIASSPVVHPSRITMQVLLIGKGRVRPGL
ncbi:hypothetical protein J6590_047752 [Homalodisca vitripennis]|nr:hypothetical protein J6590_047752 [Homalodisca vitripennis]